MSSQRRIRASRANGALSRGPVTPEGRARSALNALDHGLSADQVVLSSESEDDFNRLRDAFHAEFVPKSPLDTDLVEQLAAARWRIRRSWGLETGLFEIELLNQKERIAEEFESIEDHVRTAVAFRALADKSRSLALLDRYEARHRRTYERTLQLLLSNRAARTEQQASQNEPDPRDGNSHGSDFVSAAASLPAEPEPAARESAAPKIKTAQNEPSPRNEHPLHAVPGRAPAPSAAPLRGPSFPPDVTPHSDDPPPAA